MYTYSAPSVASRRPGVASLATRNVVSVARVAIKPRQQGQRTAVVASADNPVRQVLSSVVSNVYKATGALQPVEPGLSELWQSMKKIDLDGVRRAINSGADLNERNSNGDTPLIAIAREGHYKYAPSEIPQALVKAGADLEAKDKNGLTALQISLLSGWQNIAILLLQNGADTGGVAAIKGRLTCPDCKRVVAEYRL